MQGTGRVLQSGPEDNVFVFFADHGGPGVICFPAFLIFNPVLHADELVNTIVEMHKNNQFKQMVFYLEACESGSMFNGLLPSNISVYAVTAATPYESSWACYYSSMANAYIGDCFSNHWMENADANPGTETLESQFQDVLNRTNTSTVCRYGDLSIAAEPVSSFIGFNPAELRRAPAAGELRRVKSVDAPLEAARLAGDDETVAAMLAQREKWDTLFARLASVGRG